MSLHIRYILLVVLVCVCNASLAVGASVTITSSGGGVFTVQGDNMKGMSGINLTIGYEKSLLSSPVVKWGTLALEADMHIANTTTTPGSIMVAIIKAEPFAQNNGPIATVTFSAQNSSCGITTVDAKVLNNAHKYVPVQVSVAAEAVCEKAADPKAIDPVLISTPGIPFSQPEAVVVPPATTVVTTTTTTAAVAAPAQLQKALGTVIMPGDIQPRKDDKPVESRAVVSSEPVEVVETATRQFKQSLPEKAAEEIEPAAINQTVYGSVLNRFRVYQGERTPEIMLALFTKDVSSSITQIPAVVV